MLDTLHQQIRQVAAQSLGEEAAAALDFGRVPEGQLGDLAIVTFPLAKLLRQNPNKIAGSLAEPIGDLDFITQCEAVGAYVNVTFDRPSVARLVHGVIDSGDLFRFDEGAGQSVVFEHTSINPNASPHIGRCRNAIIGDTLARVIRCLGFDLQVHYYVNDMGKQIALLARAFRNLESDPSFDEVLQLYIDANKEAEEDESIEQELFQMLQAFEKGDPTIRDEFRKVVDICLEGQTNLLGQLNISYDVFDRESDFVRSDKLDTVIAKLEASGALFEDENGRRVVDLKKLGFKQEDGRYLVLRRSNGSSMYVLRDLAYTCHKADLGCDVNLTVLGEDHRLYQAQLDRVLTETIGCQTPEPIFYSFVVLKEGKMSTRRGTLVLLSELLELAQERALERLAESRPNLDEESRQTLSKQIAMAAIRFSLMRVAPTSNVTFDINEAVAFEGDTGPYLQYTAARFTSLLTKAAVERPVDTEPDWSQVGDPEWKVLGTIARFRETVQKTFEDRNPAPLCNYALSLAQAANQFYHASPVLKAESDGLYRMRLEISRVAREVLVQCVGLMGIEAPDKI